MNLKKLIYSITASSIIATVAFSALNTNKVQASTNKITAHDIKTKNYYGRKALVYYGFKHAGGVWTVNRNMNRVITFFKNSWSVWQGGEGGATNFTVKGKYVHFGQKTIGDQHKKPLIVKVSTVSKYVNKHGGKHMLKSIKKLGTLHQIESLTDNGQKIIQ